MGILSYAMSISVDGYVEDATGSIAYSVPSEEVHRFHNEHTRETAVFLFGRGLYEVMEDYWTDPARAGEGDVEAEFARLYVDTPRVVFSDSLESVAPGCRLVRSAEARDEVARLKRETDGELSVGGAGLAASLLDLIDEFRPTVLPIFLGGGKPYFPPGAAQLPLRLVEEKVFADGVVHLRYVRTG